jgi:hypothetical protein
VALFKWLLPISPNTDLQSLDAVVESLGFEIDQSISSKYQLYATDPATSKVEYSSRVSILITRCNKDSRDFTVEVRSSEPMLRKNTRCEQKAKELQAALEQK